MLVFGVLAVVVVFGLALRCNTQSRCDFASPGDNWLAWIFTLAAFGFFIASEESFKAENPKTGQPKSEEFGSRREERGTRDSTWQLDDSWRDHLAQDDDPDHD